MNSRLLLRSVCGHSKGARGLCYPSVPLNEPIGDINHKFASPDTVGHSSKTSITTLTNGLRVASQESFGQYSTVGVFVNAGSRHETGYPPGITHLLTKLAFMGSSNFRSFKDIDAEVEKIGGVPDIKAFRDIMYYNLSCYSFALPQAMMLLSDMLWRPLLTDRQFEDGKSSAIAEYEDMGNIPVPESLLMDLAHQASYRDNTLGLPGLCTPDTVNNINISHIQSFLSTYFVPSRLVVVGANINHTELVELAEKHFVNQTTNWVTVPSSTIDNNVSVYTGGMAKVSRMSAPVVGPNRLPDLTHVAVSLESSSYSDKDFFAFAVLNSLMGGGGSFSAGGPGKGMYTQLYLRVLNQYHWIYHAQALNHAYSDSGTFCLFGSTHPQKARHLVDVLCQEFYHMAEGHDEISLTRAKKMLQSALLMNLESRAINFEDIGRQVLGHNQRHTAQYLCEQIDAVTSKDIMRLGEKMCEQLPSVAALGDLSELPDIEEIETAFKTKQSLISKRRNYFFR